MKDRKKAIYLLAGKSYKGYVKDASSETREGLYWFNTKEREKEGRPDLLVSAEDLKIVVSE